jgi:hypothetical protein
MSALRYSATLTRIVYFFDVTSRSLFEKSLETDRTAQRKSDSLKGHGEGTVSIVLYIYRSLAENRNYSLKTIHRFVT